MTVQVSPSQARTTGSLRYAKCEMGQKEATRLADLRAALEPLEERLTHHPVFGRLQSIEDVAVFMSHDVFAVWDFMTLLQSLQTRLTSTALPWRPTGDPATRRFIHALLLEEESDELAPGRYASHYELYLEAMAQAGASDVGIRSLLDAWQSGARVTDVVEAAGLPEAVESYVTHTWRVAATLEDHSVAAAFVLGRAAIVPTLFSRLIGSLPPGGASRLTGLEAYLNRHVEPGAEHLDELALGLLCRLCGDDDRKWHDALVVAQATLEARITLWDGVTTELDRKLN